MAFADDLLQICYRGRSVFSSSAGAQVHNNSKETVSIVSIAKTQCHIKILEASLASLCATGPRLAEKSATFAFGVYTLNVNIVADLSAGPRNQTEACQ